MKRIVCLILTLTICLSILCGRGTTYNENGVEVNGYYNYITIKDLDVDHVVYDRNTFVVFYLQKNSYGGYLAPYQIYQDGMIYGAVYEDGNIVPVPYATVNP
jgi:hypothetical protein